MKGGGLGGAQALSEVFSFCGPDHHSAYLRCCAPLGSPAACGPSTARPHENFTKGQSLHPPDEKATRVEDWTST
jgi:hypothetical protein